MDLRENELRGYIEDNGKPMWTAHNNHNIRYFKEEDIRIITNNYDTLLGKGAFGEVYKGVLDDTSSVAVKRYIHNVKENFAKEVIVHCQINHRNVVRLIGCCIGENALMMVTEYISKGNLSDILHHSEISINLDTRLGIAIGCAEALTYMHSQMYGQVIHGDVKPANILLDEDLNAKVSDFGISKLLSTDNTLYTTNVLGSIGYMDPLFARTGCLTSKSDVYSFGVVLLELITRKKANNGNLTENFTQAIAKQKKLQEFYDVEVADENNLRILDEIGKLAAKCLAMDLEKRPQMKDVVESLRMFRKGQYQLQEKMLLFGWVRRSKRPPQNMVPTDKHFHGNQVLKAKVQTQKVSEVDRDVHNNVTIVREGSLKLHNFGSSQGMDLEQLLEASSQRFEEGEIQVLASQQTVEPSAQRFEAQTPQGAELGDVDVRLGATTPLDVGMQNIDVDMGRGGARDCGVSTRRIKTRKGTITATLDFDESDEDVFDEEAKDARAARLTESTVNVNTGEKIACQLEEGLTTEAIFRGSTSQKETTVDVGSMKEVVHEPATPAEVPEPIPEGVDPDAYKRCLDYCQAQGVPFDAFKFVGIGLDRLRILPKKSELRLSKCIDDVFAVPDAEAELAGKSSLELADAIVAMVYKSAILQRSLRRSLEEDAKAAALREKSLSEEVKSLKLQLAEKEKERVSTVETLHAMETRCISTEAKLEQKEEDFGILQKDLDTAKKEIRYLQKKMGEKDQVFLDKCNRLWELCKNCYDKFGAKPEDASWELGEFDPFFGWLCRQYEDLSTVLQTTADLSVMYSTRALFHLMKEAKDPLYDQLLDKNYKFPSVESLSQVSSRTQVLCKKYFHEYWNQGGREHTFTKAKKKMQKQLETEIAASEAELREADRIAAERGQG